jgi:hypothetical protein
VRDGTGANYFRMIGPILAGVLLLTGCDSVYVRTQSLEVLVTRLDGSPAGETAVTAAPLSWAPNNVSRERYVQMWEENNENTARTNADGIATIELDTTVIVGGIARLCMREPPLRDEVGGRDYLFRIRNDDSSEYMEVRIAPGAIVKGRSVQMTVKSIGPPTRME